MRVVRGGYQQYSVFFQDTVKLFEYFQLIRDMFDSFLTNNAIDRFIFYGQCIG